LVSIVSIVTLGFLLGMRHATDADHVIAVATIVGRERYLGGALRIGTAWGLGHFLTILLVGGVMILTGVTIPPNLALASEFMVGVMLVVLGVQSLMDVKLWICDRHGATPTRHHHAHAHAHGDYAHRHAHGHGVRDHGHRDDATPLASLDRRLRNQRLYQLTRPLVVGIVHGLAGSAAATLLVMAAIHDSLWALVYLALFGAGTIVGMIIVTFLIAVPVSHSADWRPRWTALLRVGLGALSVVFGVVLMFQIAIVHTAFY
jgi:cytochrome c biogenesis protein CcdA